VSETPIEEPTETPPVEPTETEEPEPTATATAVNAPLVIDEPVEDREVVVGRELVVSGRAQAGMTDSLVLRLQVAARNLVTDTVSVTTAGAWEVAVMIPPQITGPAQLSVQTQDGEETATVALEILPDPDTPGISLKRPAEEDVAVAGYGLFFEGRVREPIDRTVTIGLLTNDCTSLDASQSFAVTGGVWFGFLVLPPDFTGPACAVAYTGEEMPISLAEGEWRAAWRPITVLSSANEQAASITLGHPAGTTFKAGQTARLFGVAVNAPNNEVRVTVILDEGQNVLAEGIAPVDAFGFWEIELPLPAGDTGPAAVTVSMGSGNSYIEYRATTVINP
jgi:hypothetical protein